MLKGTLYLIPVPLADSSTAKSLTPYLVATINQLNEYIVENEKTARKCLKAMGLQIPQSDLVIHDYGKHARTSGHADFFKGLESGKGVGLMSEVGCPCIADPGAAIVYEAHRRNIKVLPLVGPSAIFLALMASGLQGQSFAFHGYLPIRKEQRIKKIKELEQNARCLKQTQIFIETPFRNNQLLTDILNTCQRKSYLCIACDLTAQDELIQTKTIAAWKSTKLDLHKRPSIFLLACHG